MTDEMFEDFLRLVQAVRNYTRTQKDLDAIIDAAYASVKKETGGLDYIKELVIREFGVRCKEDLPLLINDKSIVGICARRVMRG